MGFPKRSSFMAATRLYSTSHVSCKEKPPVEATTSVAMFLTGFYIVLGHPWPQDWGNVTAKRWNPEGAKPLSRGHLFPYLLNHIRTSTFLQANRILPPFRPSELTTRQQGPHPSNNCNFLDKHPPQPPFRHYFNHYSPSHTRAVFNINFLSENN